MYDLTFNYDFQPVRKRDASSVLVRIDYSDDPGYWSQIVDKPGVHKREALQAEVDGEHGGSWPRYMHHRWRRELREAPLHERDGLRKRWFSATAKDWIDEFSEVDAEYTAVRHTVSVRI